MVTMPINIMVIARYCHLFSFSLKMNLPYNAAIKGLAAMIDTIILTGAILTPRTKNKVPMTVRIPRTKR